MKSTRSRSLSRLLFLMIVGLLVAAPGAAAKTKTTVTIKSQGSGFSGFVKSAKGSCEAGRKVTLYKQSGSKKNRKKDRKIGTDTAQPNGPDSQWSINTGSKGKFYAYVTARGDCHAASSKTAGK